MTLRIQIGETVGSLTITRAVRRNEASRVTYRGPRDDEEKSQPEILEGSFWPPYENDSHRTRSASEIRNFAVFTLNPLVYCRSALPYMNCDA